MDKDLAKDVVAWDIPNWKRAIEFWETDATVGKDLTGKNVLEIGGGHGGLSLWWALKGANVVFSDIFDDDFDKVKALHKKYGFETEENSDKAKISYEIIDALTMDFKEKFDIVTFKSVLGAVGRLDGEDKRPLMIKNIWNALKPGGLFCFAENLTGSSLHRTLRKAFVPWSEYAGGCWKYLKLEELSEFSSDFADVKYKTFGFLGIIGSRLHCGNLAGKIDSHFDHLLSEKLHYIVSCVMRKGENKN